MTYRPGTLASVTERTIRDDLESGEMDRESAILCLMDLYGWTYRDARDEVEDWLTKIEDSLWRKAVESTIDDR